MTVRDEIICCSETKTKRDRCPQHLPSLPSTCVEKNLRTGLKFAFPIRPHLTSPASRKSERLTSPGRFPRCLPSRDFLTSLMQPIHTSGKERKGKEEESLPHASLFKSKAAPASPVQAEGPARWARHTWGSLCSPHVLSLSTGISSLGWGTSQNPPKSPAEDAMVAFICQTIKKTDNEVALSMA